MQKKTSDQVDDRQTVSDGEPAREQLGVELRPRHRAPVLGHDILDLDLPLDVRRLEAFQIEASPRRDVERRLTHERPQRPPRHDHPVDQRRRQHRRPETEANRYFKVAKLARGSNGY